MTSTKSKKSQLSTQDAVANLVNYWAESLGNLLNSVASSIVSDENPDEKTIQYYVRRELEEVCEDRLSEDFTDALGFIATSYRLIGNKYPVSERLVKELNKRYEILLEDLSRGDTDDLYDAAAAALGTPYGSIKITHKQAFDLVTACVLYLVTKLAETDRVIPGTRFVVSRTNEVDVVWSGELPVFRSNGCLVCSSGAEAEKW